MRSSVRNGFLAAALGALLVVPVPSAAQAGGDAQSAARAAARQCAKQRDAMKKVACYEGILVPVAEQGALGAALATLEALASIDPDVRRDGHMYVHGLGIAAYDRERDPAETFTECSELFHAGCYHGVIQAHFAETGAADSAEVNGLCTRVRARNPDGWTYFQCVHGLGHGLTILNGHDLVQGLAGCDLLTGAWERDSCYGGVFMENVGNATHPHHTALTSNLPRAEGAGHDGHTGHGAHGGQGGAAAAEPFKAIDPADPHYPCTLVGEQYLAACYGMQTTVMLHLNGNDFAKAAATCDGAPESVRAICHQSLGRDASGFSEQDHEEVLRLCGLDRSADAPWCYVGAVKAITDWSGKPDEGMAFCAATPEGPARTRCFEGLGEQINIMVATAEDRRAACEQAPAEQRAVCLYGARLIGEKPAALRTVEGR
jgi:hypothetical protein